MLTTPKPDKSHERYRRTYGNFRYNWLRSTSMFCLYCLPGVGSGYVQKVVTPVLRIRKSIYANVLDLLP